MAEHDQRGEHLGELGSSVESESVPSRPTFAVPLLADYEVEAMAAEFIAEDWTPDRYYREMNLIAFSNALQVKVRAALTAREGQAAASPAPTEQAEGQGPDTWTETTVCSQCGGTGAEGE